MEERTTQLKKRSKMVRSLVEKKMLLDQKLLQEKIDKQIQITQATIYGQEKERKGKTITLLNYFINNSII